MKIELDPEYIAFNEPEARKSSNGTGNEELCEPVSENHPDIVINSSSDNAAQQLTMEVEADNCARWFLHFRLTSVSGFGCVYLDILGESLDWRQILQDLEANTLELRWTFYRGTQRLAFDSSEDDSNGRIVDEFEVEEDDRSPEERNVHSASKSAIENMPTHIICSDKLDTENGNCSICRFDMADDEEVKQLPCKHLHHSGCIIKWLNTANSCPLCRYKLPTDDPKP